MWYKMPVNLLVNYYILTELICHIIQENIDLTLTEIQRKPDMPTLPMLAIC